MPYRERYFRRLRGRVRNHPVVGFDVEGTGEEGCFVLGVVYDGEPHVFYDREAMLDFLLSHRYRGACLYAHNLVYDLGILAQPFNGNWELFDAKGRLIRAVFRDEAGHKWLFLDTGNLLPNVSLDYLGSIVGLPKGETPSYLLNLTPEKVARIRRSPDKMAEVREYCIRDARIVYEFVLLFQQICNELGGNHQATLASTAMDIYRHSFQPEDYRKVPEWANDFARPAYYGGRTEVFTYGTLRGIKAYDFNSLYPTMASSLDFPHPDYLVYHPSPKDCSLILNYEGISDVLIEAPPLHIPLLPARVGKRIVFPIGRWRGRYTHLELRAALQMGYKIHHVFATLYSREVCHPFDDYVNSLWALRKRYQAQGSGMEKVVKFLLNGLTGKFGQLRSGGGRVYKRLTSYREFMESEDATVVIWQGVPFLVREVARETDPVFVNVPWIAYITSGARLALYSVFRAVDWDVCYCDTDSIYTPRELPTGEELGELKLEGEFDRITFLRAKMKFGFDREGRFKSTVKGVPWEHQYDFCYYGRASWQRPTKLRTAVNKNVRLSIWQEAERSLRDTPLKRAPLREVDLYRDYTPSRPLTYEEACERFRVEPSDPWEGVPGIFDAELV